MSPITILAAMKTPAPQPQSVGTSEMTTPFDIFAQMFGGTPPPAQGSGLREVTYFAAPAKEEIAKEITENALLPAILASLPPFLQPPPTVLHDEEHAPGATTAVALPKPTFQAQQAPSLPSSSMTNIMPQLANKADASGREAQQDTGRGSSFLHLAAVEVDSPTAPTFFTLPQIPSVEAAIVAVPLDFEVPQLNLARDMMWLDELAQDIVAAAQNEDQLSFRLLPRELGRMDVNLSTSVEGLHVRLSTSTEDARAIVAAQQPRLIEELRGQGIRVSEAEVNTSDHRHPERNPSGMMPYIETATETEPVVDTKIYTRPQGRFA